MKRLLALSFLPLFCFTVTGQQNITSGLSNHYLGQKPPGMIPELFAPDIIATGYYERDITISPDGTEIFYGILTGRHVTVLYTRHEDGKWLEPEIPQFARNSRYFFLEPCFFPDEKTVYFLSTKPPDEKYLFFSSRTTSERMKETLLKNTPGSIKEYLNNPQNGNYDINWVSTVVIEALHPK